jgi:hypothetical protein
VEGVLVKASLISLVRKGFPIAATILLLVALLFYSNLILLRVESVPQGPAFLGFSLIALNLPLTEGSYNFFASCSRGAGWRWYLANHLEIAVYSFWHLLWG